MGAHVLTGKFSQVLISVLRRGGSAVGVGIVFRSRQGANVRKAGFLVEEASPEQATYQAILIALAEAQRCQVNGLTIYVDSAQVVDELNRKVRVVAPLLPAFAQVRCAANTLRRVRFSLGNAAQTFSARRLARTALQDRRPVNIEYDTPLLPLNFGEEFAQRQRPIV
jgi:ribonuclease HI